MPLPWRHFRPASMTSHFEESTMKGTLATSGSLASSCRKRVIAATPSIIPSSMQMSRRLRRSPPAGELRLRLLRTCLL